MNASVQPSAVSGDISSVVAELIEDLANRVQAGERIDAEAVIAAHPEHAEQLRRLLPAVEVLADLGRSASAAGTSPPQVGSDDQPASGVLGDFRIIREVGRGGMGIVYEAEQISLGRRVALKVLPFAATMDPRQLQRFHNEARAAASLDHSHIVHVHAVGCERAVHFYAMQFIDGQTLSAMIADLRGNRARSVSDGLSDPSDPSLTLRALKETAEKAGLPTERTALDPAYFRRVAEWGIQAAEALDHAHGLGIVHRDVKPANLLVDGQGHLWVTDFGLAHVQSDTRVTMTGDLVGTLRYMSPEQALAQRAVIDHRTDVYSLGATLYELLTLEPAFTGSDRQELLRQIAFEEPRPPRRINRSIPAELEIIVLKALEKNPAERYTTAQELADDLRRWLDGQVIRARRPTLRQRAQKWVGRHRPVVYSGLVVLALSLLVLGSGFGWAARDQAARRAETERVVAEALKESVSMQEQRRLPEALSAAQRAAGVATSGTADEPLLRRVAARLADMELVAQLEQVRLDMAAVRDPDGLYDWAGGDGQHALIFRQAGLDVEVMTPDEVRTRLQESTVVLELATALDFWAMMIRRRVQKPNDAGWHHLLRVASAIDPDDTRDGLRTALEQRDQEALLKFAEPDQARHLLPQTLCVLAHALQSQGLKEEALALLNDAQHANPDDFWINDGLAYLYRSRKPPRPEEAVRFSTAALALRPQSAGAHMSLGIALAEKGDLDGAIAEYRECLRFKVDYAGAYYNIGNALGDKGNIEGQIAEYREAIRIQSTFYMAHNNLGTVLLRKGDLDQAIIAFRQALEIKKDHSPAHNNLGQALARLGKREEAAAEYRLAIQFNKDDAEAHSNLGIVLHQKRDMQGAIDELHKAIDLKPELAEAHAELAQVLLDGKKDVDGAIKEYGKAIFYKKDFAGYHYNLGCLWQMKKGDADRAIAEYREAIRIKEDHAEAHCNLGMCLRYKGQFIGALAYFRRGHALGSKDPHWPYPSAQWVKECEGPADLEEKLPRILSGKEQPADADQRIDYATMCQMKHLYSSAVGLYREAIKAEPALVASPPNGIRYNAARAAALAGCGAGEDAARLGYAESADLRKQASDWLRADLELWRGVLEAQADKARPVVAKRMQDWLAEKDFNVVRGPGALNRLPETERNEWQKLWEEVAALGKRAGKPK